MEVLNHPLAKQVALGVAASSLYFLRGNGGGGGEEKNVLFERYSSLKTSPLSRYLVKLASVDPKRCWEVFDCVDAFLELEKDGNRGGNSGLMNRILSGVEGELKAICKDAQRSRDVETAICAIEYMEEEVPALLYGMETILRNTLLKDRW